MGGNLSSNSSICRIDSCRKHVTALFERFGRECVAAQALEPGLHYWFYGSDACVAFYDTKSAWVTAGSPLCPPGKETMLLGEFYSAALAAKRRVCFFGTETQHPAFVSYCIGEQPEWAPADWPLALRKKRSLKEQLRRARAKGVTIRWVSASEVAGGDPTLHQGVVSMARSWQTSRAMAPMSFLVTLDLFGFGDHKHYFVAERDGRVVGALVAVSLPARQGWFFEDVLRNPSAPNGTVELLFDHAMRSAIEVGIDWVSYGLAPLSGEISPMLRKIRDATTWLYSFHGLRRFKEKLLPNKWRPVYLSIPRGASPTLAFWDTLTAFSGGSLLRFGVRTLHQRGRLALRRNGSD